MRVIFVLIHYVWWHYTNAVLELSRNYLNILGFLENFFSLGHLSRNLLSPWKRLGEEYPRRFDPGAFVSTLIVNLLMRVVGIFVRLIFIVFGLMVILLSTIVFVLFLTIWLFLPFILVALFIFAFRLILG